jgi:hypothetical protein
MSPGTSPLDRHEIYFADSAHDAIVLPRGRIGHRTAAGLRSANEGEKGAMEVNLLPLRRVDSRKILAGLTRSVAGCSFVLCGGARARVEEADSDLRKSRGFPKPETATAS